ncbi:MAG: dihydropteroate synthase [Myxococcota bacterium]|nr:dihydropteroate synthase [Myxococcota bacterium]
MSKPPWLRQKQPVVMGILNLTPDSFSDGGELVRVDDVLRRAERMVTDGAALLDLGAVSTRPGAPEVSEEEELRRLLPALDAVLREGFGAVSVDTFRPAVARAALRAGASMINDVYGARQPGMLKVLGEHKPWVCVMHMKGSPQTMQKGAIAYQDVVEQVAAWLDESAGAVVAAGVPQDCVLVDPGIGFGKTDAHNLALTLGCQRLASRTGCAVLYGASRKSIIGRLAAVDAPKKRLPGSLSLLGGAYRSGARVFRVHDVEETVQFLALERALLEANDLAAAYQ